MKLKKIVSLGLALALVCSNLPEMQLTVRAEEISSVSTSDYETWVQADGTIEIMKYTGSETSLVVPSEIDGVKVTSIGSMTFSECSNLTSVTIPEGITNINSYAFDGCSRLSSISIAESVTTIGENAFRNCSKLTKVIIPDNVTSIGSFAFSGCSSLIEVTLPNGLLMMGTDVFGGCSSNLKLVIWPESDGENYVNLEGISYRYIYDYGYLQLPDDMLELTAYTGTEKEIVIPSEIDGKKVAIIGYVFNNRTDLTSITIPESVSEISHSAFCGCSGLSNITIPKGITFIGDWAFSGCSGLSSITLPEKITSIGNATFENCTALTSMTIPEGVTAIGESAFKGCSKLSKITIPESVTSIGEAAFENCNDNLTLVVWPGSYAENYAVWNNISYYYAYNDNFSYTELADGTLEITGYTGSETEIIIPAELDGKKVTSIGEMAFQTNNKLTKISISEGITNIGELAFWNVRKVNEIIIPKSVTNIDEMAFLGCSSLINITLPEGITSIGEATFAECSSLSTITIPNSVTSIGKTAFRHCSNLKTIEIPEGITSLSEGAFRNCTSLSEITLPESLENIGESAFSDCSSLRAISIPEGVTSIEKSAFSNCSNLEAITIPDGVTTLSQSLFSGCVMLHEFTVPEGIVTIEDSVFGGCSGLSKITISSKVKQIGTCVFQGCSFLTSIHIDSNNKNFIAENGILYNKEKTKLICCSPANIGRVTMLDSVTSIEDYAFYACNNISEVVLSEGVTSIGKYAFENCSSLDKMVLPANVTSIGDWAFYGCRKLSEIIMPDNLTSIGKNAFQHCSSLTEITIPDKVTTIGRQAFGSCINLKEITIPDGVTSIEDDTFGGCSSLSKIIIPESVKTIKTYAFNLCSSLTEITIPASVESIDKSIFNRCSEDLVVVVAPDSCAETYAKENSLLYRYIGTQDSEYSYVILPDGTLRIVGYTGSETDITIPSEIDEREVTQIGKQAFSGNTNLSSVTIPDGITSIGAGAFDNCSTTLLLLVTPDSAAETYAKANNMLYRYIGDPAPEYTYYVLNDDTLCITGYTGNEAELIFPSEIDGKRVTYIDDGSFSECMDITKVVIPQGVTNIGEKAFSGCRNLTEVTIPEGLTFIGAEAFYNCSSLTSITIPESVGWIDTYTFAYCTSLKEVILPDSMGTIGNYAFFACSSLTAIELPENLTKIGYMAFDSCSSLTSVTIPKGVRETGGHAFSYCKSLTSVTLSEGVSYISAWGFYGCSSLTEVILPESLYGIGVYAFSGCGKLKELEISKNVTQISKPVFDKSMTLLVWRDSYAESYAIENKASYRYLGETVDGYCYEVLEDNTLEITSYKGTDTELIIPFEIDGKTVTSISADAFAGCNNITRIALSKAVTHIGENAFAECSEDLVLAVWQGSYAETYVKENNVSYSYTETCDHIYKGKVVVIKEATCTENGEKTIACILCGDNSMESIPAKGHNLVTDKAVEATCTSVGRTEGSHCSVCNTILKAQEDIPMKEHESVTDEAVVATCVSVGRTEGSHCSVCNTVLKEQQEVPVKEHSCQTIVQRATTKKDGSIIVQCTVCSNVVSESIIYKPKTATLSTTSYMYNGKAKKPSVSVKDTAGNKISSDYYTVVYSNNKKVGKAVVTIKFKGNYSGTIKKTFTIKPKGTNITTLKKKSKGFVVKWKKQSTQTSGYQIQYSTNKNFKGKTTGTKTVTKNATIAKTILKLSGQKKYYVRVRTYKIVKVNGKNTKIYSGWSKVKAITTKK